MLSPSASFHPLSPFPYQKHLKEYVYWMNEVFFIWVRLLFWAPGLYILKFLIVSDSIPTKKTTTVTKLMWTDEFHISESVLPPIFSKLRSITSMTIHQLDKLDSLKPTLIPPFF